MRAAAVSVEGRRIELPDGEFVGMAAESVIAPPCPPATLRDPSRICS